jgi:phage shock protein PspC (stress-responsive transcriptional regulator)
MTTRTGTLTKDADNAMAGGVCAGLANYFDIDPVLVRAMFVAGTVLSGFSIVLYAVLWLALDDAPEPDLVEAARSGQVDATPGGPVIDLRASRQPQDVVDDQPTEADQVTRS